MTGVVTTAARTAAAVRRRWASGLIALLCAWSGVWLAVWLLVADALTGSLLSAVGSSISTALVGGNGGASPGVGALSVAGGAIQGTAVGLASALVSLVGHEPLQLGVSLAGGLVLSLALLAVSVTLEPWLLHLGGCRRLSRREAARVMPLLHAAATGLGMASLPLVLAADGDDLRVRAHARHLVVGRSLLDELDTGPGGDAELAAVLCHGLHHWAVGDGVGLRFVRLCGLPLVILYDAGCWMAEQGGSFVALVGWLVLWPAWLLVRMVMSPAVAIGSRRQEYEADLAVAAAGHGAALHRALTLLGELEPGRTGWDRVVTATHPPRELRLEALEPQAQG